MYAFHHINIDLYADDSTLYTSCTDLKLIQSNMQYNLTCIQTWCTSNSWEINLIPNWVLGLQTNGHLEY